MQTSYYPVQSIHGDITSINLPQGIKIQKLAPAGEESRDYKPSVLAIEYLPDFELIAISTSENELHFWDTKLRDFEDENVFNPPRFVNMVHTKSSLLKITWSVSSKQLFAMISSSEVQSYSVNLLRPEVELSVEGPTELSGGYVHLLPI